MAAARGMNMLTSSHDSGEGGARRMEHNEPSPAPAASAVEASAVAASTAEASTAPPGTVEERLADILKSRDVCARAGRVLRQLGELDRAVYTAVAATPTPDLDAPMRRLSLIAGNSRIWLGVAAGLAVFGGSAGRRAAGRGILAICATSAVVNAGIKPLSRRRRPDRAGAGVPGRRQVGMPSSRSFPSGHSASGFAFASSVGQDLPALSVPLRLLAGAVAYSRVHTGVHYPSDAVIGSIVGAGIAQTINGLTERAIDVAWRPGRDGNIRPASAGQPASLVRIRRGRAGC
jgi:membrane-associated phospholipid phosphatase